MRADPRHLHLRTNEERVFLGEMDPRHGDCESELRVHLLNGLVRPAMK